MIGVTVSSRRTSLKTTLFETDEPLQKRQPYDFYPTPAETVEIALQLIDAEPRRILDPGAGAGAWGKGARGRWPAAQIVGVEARKVPAPTAYDEWHVGPFEQWARQLRGFDLVIGNPPYLSAEEFVKLSLGLLEDGGRLLFLLPLEFVAGDKRGRGLYREAPPERIVVCSKRPKFYGDWSASRDFALFLWRKGWRGDPSLSWLDRYAPADDAQLSLT